MEYLKSQLPENLFQFLQNVGIKSELAKGLMSNYFGHLIPANINSNQNFEEYAKEKQLEKKALPLASSSTNLTNYREDYLQETISDYLVDEEIRIEFEVIKRETHVQRINIEGDLLSEITNKILEYVETSFLTSKIVDIFNDEAESLEDLGDADLINESEEIVDATTDFPCADGLNTRINNALTELDEEEE